jgi:GTP-binding protein HflX
MLDNLRSNEKESYILVGVTSWGEDNTSLDELEALLETAGGEAVFKVTQHLDKPDPATYVGKGKADELRSLIEIHEATGILCDDELTPAQIRNLSDTVNAKVIDRTVLILDIFAAHAATNEGKIQVEMAQQKYRLSHLQGLGKSLSRLGGGIGTRGPGETKLESDRRRILKRISILKNSIASMKRVRETTRKKRENNGIPVIAVMGYTNAGKATLLNRMTGAGVLAQDMLFATLDPTTRICHLPGGRDVLMTDTVGFINKLPHNLIDAFRSTLEEVKYADILLHVVDASAEDMELHMDTVYSTLNELKVTGKPVITLYNKVDLLTEEEINNLRFNKDPRAEHSLEVSVLSGEGIDGITAVIEEVLRKDRELKRMTFSYNEVSKLDALRRTTQIVSEEYFEDGIVVEAYL